MNIDAITFVEKDLENIEYIYTSTPFGKAIIAETNNACCYLSFCKDKKDSLNEIKSYYKNSEIKENNNNVLLKEIKKFLNSDISKEHNFRIIAKGTPFQQKIWTELTKTHSGETLTYKQIAEKISTPKATRAVGTAIGKNVIAILIPCHRIILANGKIGKYRWGTSVKQQILKTEKKRAVITDRPH